MMIKMGRSRISLVTACAAATAVVFAAVGCKREGSPSTELPDASPAKTLGESPPAERARIGRPSDCVQHGDGYPAPTNPYVDGVAAFGVEGPFAPLGSTLTYVGGLDEFILVSAVEGNHSSSISRLSLADDVPRWRSGGQLTVARAWHTATVLNDCTVYVAGGVGSDSGTLPEQELLDLEAGTTAHLPPLQTPRDHHAAVRLADGRVLLIGGRTSGVASRSVEIYVPAARLSQNAAPMQLARYDHTATLLQDGRVIVIGGMNETGYLATSEFYDPATDTWQPGPKLARGRARHSAVALSDGRVAVTGGESAAGRIGTSEALSTDAGAFEPFLSLDAPREGHVLAVLGSRLVAAGGAADRTTKASTCDAGCIRSVTLNSDETVSSTAGAGRDKVVIVSTAPLPGGPPGVVADLDGDEPQPLGHFDGVTLRVSGEDVQEVNANGHRLKERPRPTPSGTSRFFDLSQHGARVEILAGERREVLLVPPSIGGEIHVLLKASPYIYFAGDSGHRCMRLKQPKAGRISFCSPVPQQKSVEGIYLLSGPGSDSDGTTLCLRASDGEQPLDAAVLVPIRAGRYEVSVKASRLSLVWTGAPCP